MIDLLMRWGLPILAVIYTTMRAYDAGEEDGRRKGFMMTMWALEKGHIGVKDDDDGGKVVTVSEELAELIEKRSR